MAVRGPIVAIPRQTYRINDCLTADFAQKTARDSEPTEVARIPLVLAEALVKLEKRDTKEINNSSLHG